MTVTQLPYCRFYREVVPRDIRNPAGSDQDNIIIDDVITENKNKKNGEIIPESISEHELLSIIKTAKTLFKNKKINKGFGLLQHAIQGREYNRNYVIANKYSMP